MKRVAPRSGWRACGANTDGRLDADDWRDFRAELGAERDAARAEAERLESQLREVERWGAVKDAEAETLRRL